jgi:hypothetical protein
MEHSWAYCGNGVLYIQKKTASWNNRGFQTPTFRGKEFRTEMHYVICARIACTHIAWRRIRLENPLNQCVQVNHCNIHGCSSANLRVITEDSTPFCKRAIWRKSRTLLLWSRPTHDADFHGCAALVYNYNSVKFLSIICTRMNASRWTFPRIREPWRNMSIFYSLSFIVEAKIEQSRDIKSYTSVSGN